MNSKIGKTQINVDKLSFTSLLIEIKNNGEIVSKATGFIVTYKGKHHLITNLHVVTGRDTFTGKMLQASGTPDSITVWQNKKGEIGRWLAEDLKLYAPDSGEPIWHGHENPKVDVVAIPLSGYNNIDYHSVSLKDEFPLIDISPAETVSIVGFPFGRGVMYNIAIWKTGHIASDIDIDHEELPVFLVDATTKPSMSGSPVYFRRYNYSFMDQSTKMLTHAVSVTKYLGVYSGRIGENFDVGMVWKPQVIREIFGRVEYVDANGLIIEE